MITSKCPTCGSAVPVFAASCGGCGAPNPRRLVAVAGSLVALVAAIAIAVIVGLRRPQSSGGAPGDLSWLSNAMTECDAEAEKAPETLHFLVVPMMSAPADDAYWRGNSLNDIGNAILLRQRETLDGLADQSLVIATEQYEFSIRDEATSAVYRWSPSTGVKKFLVAGAAQIREFRVQFKTREKTKDSEWGASFTHRQGTCYWVNAIIGH